MQAGLVPLRQELTLLPGPATAEGHPTWTLHDPAANRFYQLSWAAFEMLARWHLNDPDAILATVAAETTLRPGADDFEALFKLLRNHNLLLASRAADTQMLEYQRRAGKLSHAQWLLKHYLFIRIPLLRPMPILTRLAPKVRWAYQPWFWWLIALIGMSGLFMVSRRWDAFTHTIPNWTGWTGILGIGIALSFAKVLHEFGHAFTAYRYGCRVPTMGVALLVMWPVLYTDTNEVWKLQSRWQRLRVGAAGMAAELALAACATLWWNFLSPGPLQTGMFLLATTTWISTLAINASPFMRFDGYFLLSDWLDMANLHDRAFAQARWWLREWLFGLGEPAPESFPPRRRRFLIGFAYATWLYRLTLFFSIALVVYHAFFKTLGIMLLFVELGWFILLPVQRELVQWWQRRAQIHWRHETRRSAWLLAIMLSLILLPWQGSIDAPAVMEAAQAQGLYAVQAAQIISKQAAPMVGQHVKTGDILLQLTSPDLAHQLASAEADLAFRQQQVAQQSFNVELMAAGPSLQKELDTTQEAVDGLKRQIEQLTVRAPFDGSIAEAGNWLSTGSWVAKGEKLFEIVGPHGVQATAWVEENKLRRLRRGETALFVADDSEAGAVRCRISGVDSLNAAVVDQLYVASLLGGKLPVERHGNDLVPIESTWKVRLDHCDRDQPFAREMPGVVSLAGDHISLLHRGLIDLIAVIQHEAAF